MLRAHQNDFYCEEGLSQSDIFTLNFSAFAKSVSPNSFSMQGGKNIARLHVIYN